MNDSSLRNPHWLNLVYLVEPKNLRSTGIFLSISFVVMRIMGKNLGVRQNGERLGELRTGMVTRQSMREQSPWQGAARQGARVSAWGGGPSF